MTTYNFTSVFPIKVEALIYHYIKYNVNVDLCMSSKCVMRVHDSFIFDKFSYRHLVFYLYLSQLHSRQARQEPPGAPLCVTKASHELCDVWRHLNQNQILHVGPRQGILYLWQDLIGFCCFQHHFSVFNCSMSPIGFSDHCFVHCSVFIQHVKSHSAYWHFNTALLQDNSFRDAFTFL